MAYADPENFRRSVKDMKINLLSPSPPERRTTMPYGGDSHLTKDDMMVAPLPPLPPKSRQLVLDEAIDCLHDAATNINTALGADGVDIIALLSAAISKIVGTNEMVRCREALAKVEKPNDQGR